MTFDDLKELCVADIEKYRDNFLSLHDLNGTCFSETVGFLFGLDEDDPQEITTALEMLKLFQPVAIWCGKQRLLDVLNKKGFQGTLFSWFEDGCFMVVLKSPLVTSKEHMNRIRNARRGDV